MVFLSTPLPISLSLATFLPLFCFGLPLNFSVKLILVLVAHAARLAAQTNDQSQSNRPPKRTLSPRQKELEDQWQANARSLMIALIEAGRRVVREGILEEKNEADEVSHRQRAHFDASSTHQGFGIKLLQHKVQRVPILQFLLQSTKGLYQQKINLPHSRILNYLADRLASFSPNVFNPQNVQTADCSLTLRL